MATTQNITNITNSSQIITKNRHTPVNIDRHTNHPPPTDASIGQSNLYNNFLTYPSDKIIYTTILTHPSGIYPPTKLTHPFNINLNYF